MSGKHHKMQPSGKSGSFSSIGTSALKPEPLITASEKELQKRDEASADNTAEAPDIMRSHGAIKEDSAEGNGLARENGISFTEKEKAEKRCMTDGAEEQSEYCSDPVRNNDIYIPVGASYVRAARESDNRHPRSLPHSSGIVYEVAEELYRKEKTASEIEALCQPPFCKVFDRSQKEKLDLQASEKTNTLISNLLSAEKQAQPEKAEPDICRPLSTGSALMMQLIFLLPGVNLIAAMVYAFRPRANRNKKACSRAFLLCTLFGMTAALGFFAFHFFSTGGRLPVTVSFAG